MTAWEDVSGIWEDGSGMWEDVSVGKGITYQLVDNVRCFVAIVHSLQGPQGTRWLVCVRKSSVRTYETDYIWFDGTLEEAKQFAVINAILIN